MSPKLTRDMLWGNGIDIMFHMRTKGFQLILRMRSLFRSFIVCHASSTHSIDFVCVEVLRPSQPNGVMSSADSLPNHTFTGQA